LLHDHGIVSTTPAEDFTLRSAARTLAAAAAAGVAPERGELLADAICAHITPGVDVAADGSLAAYIQMGAMVDGAGLRSWDVAPEVRTDVFRRHPRDGFSDELIAMVRAEAAAVPGGRFALLRRCGMTMAVRMAPHPS
jgi:hypothetical protein